MAVLMLAETLVALGFLAVFVVIASGYPMPSGGPSPTAILIGAIPLVSVLAGWWACLEFVKRGLMTWAVTATLIPVAIFLLFLGAM